MRVRFLIAVLFACCPVVALAEAAEVDVREFEAPPDDPAVAEELLDLTGSRGGRDVEVLRLAV